MNPVESFTIHMGPAHASFDSQQLELQTGTIQRSWKCTQKGLLTTSLQRIESSHQWISPHASTDSADWFLRGISDACDAELISTEAIVVDNDRYLAPHLHVRFVFRHADPGFDITWEARAWPNAPGIWTQLAIKPITPFDAQKDRDRLPSYLGWAYSERLYPVVSADSAKATGLYSDTQHRNYDHLPLLRTEEVPLPGNRRIITVDWANLLTLNQSGEGLTLVKESPKCVNTPHMDTGEFVLQNNAVTVTGLGISPAEYGSSPFWTFPDGLTCWANWMILHPAHESERQLAIKQFDRARFPFRPERDGMVMANTWGSAGSFVVQGREGSPSATNESRLLREIESCRDLGIDILQIDHGWNFAPESQVHNKTKNPWQPHPQRLPNGWQPIREAADAAGLELGLWFSVSAAYDEPEAILENVRALNLKRLKLDFMSLRKVDDVDSLRRAVTRLTDMLPEGTGINWDMTEGIPRVGYFLAREYGNIFLTNRENGPGPMKQGSHIEYIPRLALRDAWQLAHVLNLNQIQITVQDKDATPQDYSNAYLYPHTYALAIALMGIPLFFQETQFLSEQAREELKPVLKKFHEHRNAMWQGFTFPIGQEPDDHSWSGFQSHQPTNQTGYLTLFREIHSEDTTQCIALHFLNKATLTVENILTGENWKTQTDRTGKANFQIDKHGQFLWLRYQKV